MVDDVIDTQLDAIVKARILRNSGEIEHSLRQIAAGNPLGAETSPERLVKRIARKTSMSIRDATAVSKVIETAARYDDDARMAGGAEAMQGPTIDFTGVEFLTRGRRAADTVGRVVWGTGAAQGTGFLVGPGVFLTNNHVIKSAALASGMQVQFDYEADDDGSQRPVTVFSFAPGKLFVSDPVEGLDYTLIAIGDRLSGGRAITEFGYIPLSDASDKHALGEIANIVQHPLGGLKQIVVRENSLVSRDETAQVLHYLADTDQGSSGALVCNNEWEAIALHHWGGPFLEVTDANGQPLRRDINEGIRISAIVKDLGLKVAAGGTMSAPLGQLVEIWKGAPRTGPVSAVASESVHAAATEATPGARPGADGSLTWVFPIEISVRAPLFSTRPNVPPVPPVVTASPPQPGPEKVARAPLDFSDRGGYEPGFIPGFVVPLPDVSGLPYALAKNKQAQAGDDPHELRYTHFSIFMNSERRLASFTACNIDGGRTVAVNRETKEITHDPSLKQLDLVPAGAESSDDFQPDPRVDAEEQMARPYYENQNAPGYEKPVYPGKSASAQAKKEYARAMAERTARIFQKGHIIMRGDPAWGADAEALAAEADTFFYTNAAPQLGFFNQGSADDRPGAKGKLRWRALETYVLRNAVTTRKRVCVFAGPVFDDKYDAAYRHDSKVPMRFWKIAVWADGGRLRSVALLADQKPVLEKLAKGVPEAHPDEEEIARVSEFVATVAEIEQLTSLDFGAEIRNGDIRAGSPEAIAVPDLTVEEFASLTNGKSAHL